MRLGGYYKAESENQLAGLCDTLDSHGLSAIPAPSRLTKMTDDECVGFGETARGLDLVIGEIGMWSNMMTRDQEARSERIALVRLMLRKADLMGCHSVVTCVGSVDQADHQLAPHPYMETNACKDEFRDVVLRVLDGLELKKTKYIIEPWNNTFFYRPEAIADFIAKVDHPSFGLHLDQMNLMSQEYFHHSTDLINTTFDLLSDYAVSVHLKDIGWDYSHMFLKYDEVLIGDGVMDYDTYLKRLSTLDEDTPCYCEHLSSEEEYLTNFTRLHALADKAGGSFRRRNVTG